MRNTLKASVPGSQCLCLVTHKVDLSPFLFICCLFDNRGWVCRVWDWLLWDHWWEG